MSAQRAKIALVYLLLAVFTVAGCKFLPEDKQPADKTPVAPTQATPEIQLTASPVATTELPLTATPEVRLSSSTLATAEVEVTEAEGITDETQPETEADLEDEAATSETDLTDQEDVDLSDIDPEFTTDEMRLIWKNPEKKYDKEDPLAPKKQPSVYYLNRPKADLYKSPDPAKGIVDEVFAGKSLVVMERGEKFFKIKLPDGIIGWVDKSMLTTLPIHITVLRSGIVENYSPDGTEKIFNPHLQIKVLNTHDKLITNLGLKADYFFEDKQIGSDFLYVASPEMGFKQMNPGGQIKMFTRIIYDLKDDMDKISRENPVTVKIFYTTFSGQAFYPVAEFKITHKDY